MGHLYTFIGKMSICGLCSFLSYIFSCCFWVSGVLYTFWISISDQLYDFQMFPHISLGYLCSLLILHFDEKYLKFSWSPVFIFSDADCVIGVISRKWLPNSRLCSFILFFLQSFIVTGLTFRLRIHFALILYIMLDMDLTSFLCKWISNFPRTICWKDCLFSSDWT